MIFESTGIASRLEVLIVQYGGLFTNPEHSFETTRSPPRGVSEPASAKDEPASSATRIAAAAPTLTANARCRSILFLLSRRVDRAWSATARAESLQVPMIRRESFVCTTSLAVSSSGHRR